MKPTTKENCPLCGATAEYYLVDYDRRKYFKCPNCTLFQISLPADERLAQAPQQWRDGYARKAKQAPEEHALFIHVPSPSQEPSSTNVALSGKYVLRSKLPQ